MDAIKQLRDATGVSVMQCKKALEETEGDMEKALVVLRKKGSEAASKKKDRTLGAGVVASYVHATGTVGAMVVLSCETDFVAKNKDFGKLAYEIAMHVTATNPEYLRAEDVREDAKVTARSVFAAEVADKPEALRGKIIEGKLTAFFKDKILLEQPFIKNQDITIQGLLDSAVQKFGEKTEITRFERFSIS